MEIIVFVNGERFKTISTPRSVSVNEVYNIVLNELHRIRAEDFGSVEFHREVGIWCIYIGRWE